MLLKGNYRETFDFLVSKESLLVYFAVLANIVNILMFHESPNLVLLNGLFIKLVSTDILILLLSSLSLKLNP